RNLAQEDLARTHPFDAHDINLALAVREEVVVDNDLAALDVPEVGPHEALSDIRPAHGGMVAPVADDRPPHVLAPTVQQPFPHDRILLRAACATRPPWRRCGVRFACSCGPPRRTLADRPLDL